MHIVFVTTELATDKNSSGGLASFTANISRIFTKNGHKVTVILSTVKETELSFDQDIKLVNSYVPKKIWDGIDRIASLLTLFKNADRAKIRNLLITLYRSKKVNDQIREINRLEKVDIVHFCNLGSVSFCANRDIPYVVRLSGITNLSKGTYLPSGEYGYKLYPLTLQEKLEEKMLQKSRYLISPSNYLAEVTRKEINTNVTVIESPFLLNDDAWEYSVFEKYLKGKKYVFHYGRLGYRKGTHVIAEMAERLLKEDPELYIVLAGNNNDMLNMSGEYISSDIVVKEGAGEYANRVIYLGKIVREQLFPIIQNAEVCIFPSRIENLSNACIESMAMGKIVVATDGVSFEQLIEDRISGFLCKRDDAESFLEGVMSALRLSEEDKKKMSMNALRSVNKLNPEKIYVKYLNFYNDVIEKW